MECRGNSVCCNVVTWKADVIIATDIGQRLYLDSENPASRCGSPTGSRESLAALSQPVIANAWEDGEHMEGCGLRNRSVGLIRSSPQSRRSRTSRGHPQRFFMPAPSALPWPGRALRAAFSGFLRRETSAPFRIRCFLRRETSAPFAFAASSAARRALRSASAVPSATRRALRSDWSARSISSPTRMSSPLCGSRNTNSSPRPCPRDRSSSS